MKKEFIQKRITFMVLAVVMMIVGTMYVSREAEAATRTSKVPITAYVKGYSSVRTYSSVGGKATGWIYSSDKCTILNVYSSGWCRVKYPVSGGSRVAYTYSSNFFTNINFSTTTTKPGKNRTVYGKPNLSTTLGTTYASDNVLIIGSSNGNQQILYPISGGYKMGFISGSISAVSTGYAPVIFNGSKAEIEALVFDAKYYADTYPDLKAAFGYDSTKLLNHWKKHGISEGRGASPVLELTYYLANNKDLQNAFGAKNYTRAYQHFLEYGYAEYRASSKYYNGDYYRRNNADLKPYDSKFLIKHYLQYGISEGRYANTVRYGGGSGGSSNSNSSVQTNIYNLAMSSMGTKGTTYQKWAGLSTSDPYCTAYATYIANQAMLNAGYSSSQAFGIVPKMTSTSYLANWYRNKGRYYSYATWYNSSRGIGVSKNTSINSYTPKVGDLVIIDNNGNISTGPEHTGLVIAVNGNAITLAEGNTGAGTNATRTVKQYTYVKGTTYWYRSNYSTAKIVGFCNPAY